MATGGVSRGQSKAPAPPSPARPSPARPEEKIEVRAAVAGALPETEAASAGAEQQEWAVLAARLYSGRRARVRGRDLLSGETRQNSARESASI